MVPTVDLSPDQLERLVLSSLATADDVLWAQRAGLRRETFLDHAENGVNATAWEYIVERVAQTGYVPTDVDLATIGFEAQPGATDHQRFVQQLVKEDAARRARATLWRFADKLEKDPYTSIDTIVAELSAIRQTNQAHSVFFDADALARYDDVKRRSELDAKGQTLGIPTGLPLFDDVGGQWSRGEMVAVMGMPTSGKSTLLVQFCVVAWAAGYRVLFISPENLADDIHKRADPMAAHFYGLQLSNRALRTGKNVDLETYHQYVSQISSERRWKTVDSGDQGLFTVGDIQRQVAEFKPDILAVDGVHLLQGPDQTWQNIFNAGKVLKGLSQERQLVTLVACQATRSAMSSSEDNPDMSQAAYGAKAIMEDSNRVVTLAKDRGGIARRTVKVPKWRDGPEINNKVYLTFDVDAGLVKQQVSTYDPTTAEVVDIDFE